MEISKEIFKPFGLSKKTNITLAAVIIVMMIIKSLFVLLGDEIVGISVLKLVLLLIFTMFIVISILLFSRRGRELQYKIDIMEKQNGNDC